MKNWTFTINLKPKQIIKKLESDISVNSAFVLNVKSKESASFYFNFRKRMQYGEQLLHSNLVIVRGEISTTDKENYSRVEIVFKQHFLVDLTKYIFSGLGLIAILTGLFSYAYFIAPGIYLLAIGIIIWIWMDNIFKKHSEQYKSLLSEIFEIKQG